MYKSQRALWSADLYLQTGMFWTPCQRQDQREQQARFVLPKAPQLLHYLHAVEGIPALDDPASGETEDAIPGYVDPISCRRNVHEFASMGSLRGPARRYLVTLGDHVLHNANAIGKGGEPFRHRSLDILESGQVRM